MFSENYRYSISVMYNLYVIDNCKQKNILCMIHTLCVYINIYFWLFNTDYLYCNLRGANRSNVVILNLTVYK